MVGEFACVSRVFSKRDHIPLAETSGALAPTTTILWITISEP